MKKLLVAAATLTLSGVAYFVFKPGPSTGTAPPLPSLGTPLAEGKVELRLNDDAVEIFRRAFWREPAAEDRLLHAERREWVSEVDGVRRWQWFLALDASPALLSWLKETNPFQMIRSSQPFALPAESAPGWFPSPNALAGCEVMQCPGQEMTLIFDPARQRLHATGHGHGFAAAASPAPTSTLTQAEPATAPPLDQRPPR